MFVVRAGRRPVAWRVEGGVWSWVCPRSDLIRGVCGDWWQAVRVVLTAGAWCLFFADGESGSVASLDAQDNSGVSGGCGVRGGVGRVFGGGLGLSVAGLRGCLTRFSLLGSRGSERGARCSVQGLEVCVCERDIFSARSGAGVQERGTRWSPGDWPCRLRTVLLHGSCARLGHPARGGQGLSKRRASGGCLGARRRRRTWHAAKILGEPRAGVDPEVSEWGNPPLWGIII